MLKILFFSSSKFGVPALKLLSQNFKINAVFTNPPKPSGRGKKLQPTIIQSEAEALNLKVINSSKPTILDIEEEFDIGVVVSYGAIISKEVLSKAKYGFLNIHPSDLPKFRGASPIERTIEAGEKDTRVCIIKMTPRLDDGNILSFVRCDIGSEENSLDLHDKFSQIGAELLLDAIPKLLRGEEGEEQNHPNSTYAKKIAKEELELKHEVLTMEQTLNKIRAFASYGFTFLTFESKRIKVLKAEASEIQKSKIDIICLDGFISPTLIKVEGKNETLNYFTI